MNNQFKTLLSLLYNHSNYGMTLNELRDKFFKKNICHKVASLSIAVIIIYGQLSFSLRSFWVDI